MRLMNGRTEERRKKRRRGEGMKKRMKKR